MRRDARVHHDGPCLLDANTCALKGPERSGAFGTKTTNLYVGAQANTHQFAFRTSLGLLGPQVLVVNQCHGLFESGSIRAAIISGAGRELVWKRLRFNEIGEAYLCRVFAQFAGYKVHRMLYQVRRLWTTGTAIRIGGRFVGKDEIESGIRMGNVITAIDHGQCKGQGDDIGEELEIGTEVGNDVDLQPRHLAIPGGSDLDVVDLTVPVNGGRETLVAALNPFYRTARLHSSKGDQGLFGINILFAAKATPHFGSNHAQLVLEEPQLFGQIVAQHVWQLCRTPHRQCLIGLAELGHHTACLHWRRNEALIDQASLHDDPPLGDGLREDLVYLISRWMLREGQIGAEFLIEHRCARLHRLLNINGRGEWLVVNIDQLESIVGYIGVLRDNDGNRIAKEAHLALSQWATPPHAFLDVGRKEHAHRHITNLTFEVLGSVDGHDAGTVACRLRLDARDACMPVRTAENGHMEHPNQFDIINICCLPRNQTGVFTPFDRCADHRCNAHVCLPFLK